MRATASEAAFAHQVQIDLLERGWGVRHVGYTQLDQRTQDQQGGLAMLGLHA